MTLIIQKMRGSAMQKILWIGALLLVFMLMLPAIALAQQRPTEVTIRITGAQGTLITILMILWISVIIYWLWDMRQWAAWRKRNDANPPPELARRERGELVCWNCGLELPGNPRRCPSCGQDQDVPPTSSPQSSS